jgi:hypothetical protein
MQRLRRRLAPLILLAGLVLAASAQAQTPARFDFVFEDSGSSATATGYIVFDLDQLPNPGSQFGIPVPSATVLDLQVTVSGATAGNGTFGPTDFPGGVVWDTGGVALDLAPGIQVVGQPVSGGPWGPGCVGGPGPQGIQGGCGDFNLLAGKGPGIDSYGLQGVLNAPNGIGPFTLAANGGSGEAMELTSFIRGVPNNVGVPTLSAWSWSLLIGVLLIAGLVAVRIRA